MASHGILDTFTNGGSGVALFAPFDLTRYVAPWRPLIVSPIAFAFFSQWGARVLLSELGWIWLPATLLVLLVRAVGAGTSSAR
jgi:inner membrane protein